MDAAVQRRRECFMTYLHCAELEGGLDIALHSGLLGRRLRVGIAGRFARIPPVCRCAIRNDAASS